MIKMKQKLKFWKGRYSITRPSIFGNITSEYSTIVAAYNHANAYSQIRAEICRHHNTESSNIISIEEKIN